MDKDKEKDQEIDPEFLGDLYLWIHRRAEWLRRRDGLKPGGDKESQGDKDTGKK